MIEPIFEKWHFEHIQHYNMGKIYIVGASGRSVKDTFSVPEFLLFSPNQIPGFLKVFGVKFPVFSRFLRLNSRYFCNDQPSCVEQSGENKKLIDVASPK